MSYLDRVHRTVRDARLQAQADRQAAIRAGRLRVARFGADSTQAALSIPPPNPVASALSQDVVSAATAAFRSTGPTTAVQEGLDAVDLASSPSALDAARAAQQPAGLAGFDAGVAMAHGAARSGGRVPRAMRAAERAGWLTAFGLEGAPAETKKAVLGTAVEAANSSGASAPAAQGFVRGASSAVSAINAGQTAVTAAGSYTAEDAWTGAGLFVGGPVLAVGAATLLGKLGLKYFLTFAGPAAAAALAVGWIAKNRYAVALANAGKQLVSPTPAALAAGAQEAGDAAGGGPAVSGPAVTSTSATSTTSS
jgi:hypothetical protein